MLTFMAERCFHLEDKRRNLASEPIKVVGVIELFSPRDGGRDSERHWLTFPTANKTSSRERPWQS